jgi:hypothetical protein
LRKLPSRLAVKNLEATLGNESGGFLCSFLNALNAIARKFGKMDYVRPGGAISNVMFVESAAFDLAKQLSAF